MNVVWTIDKWLCFGPDDVAQFFIDLHGTVPQLHLLGGSGSCCQDLTLESSETPNGVRLAENLSQE